MIIWAAQLVARVGNGLTAFGLAVHVYQQTRSSTAVAVVMLAAFLPGVLLTPLGALLPAITRPAFKKRKAAMRFELAQRIADR